MKVLAWQDFGATERAVLVWTVPNHGLSSHIAVGREVGDIGPGDRRPALVYNPARSSASLVVSTISSG